MSHIPHRPHIPDLPHPRRLGGEHARWVSNGTDFEYVKALLAHAAANLGLRDTRCPYPPPLPPTGSPPGPPGSPPPSLDIPSRIRCPRKTLHRPVREYRAPFHNRFSPFTGASLAQSLQTDDFRGPVSRHPDGLLCLHFRPHCAFSVSGIVWGVGSRREGEKDAPISFWFFNPRTLSSFLLFW